MIVRFALEADEDAVVALARANADEASEVGFDEGVFRATFRRYLTEADPTIFVAADEDGLAGLLIASMHGYIFTTGVFTIQDVLFVLPARRGIRAAAHLLRAFDIWSDTVRAREVFYGTSTGIKPASFAKLVSRTTGAKFVGNVLKRVCRR